MTRSEPVRRYTQHLVERITELQQTAAYRAVEDDPERAMAVLLRDPTLAAELDRDNLSNLLRRLEGDRTAPPVRVRPTAELPVWTIVDERDAESLRCEIAPGQVWIRWDAMTRPGRQRTLTIATAALQHRLLGKELGAAGASKGPRPLTDDQRALLADAAAGGWGYARTHREGVGRGTWLRLPDDRLDSDRAAYARVKRLRNKAERLAG